MPETPTIAIVENHDLLREEVSKVLEILGFKVLIKATNGKQFLDIIADSLVTPDLCLLDVNMPVMNGCDTASKIKKLFPGIKILAYSVNTDDKTIADIKKCGADDFMFKGNDPNELKQALLKLYVSGTKA